MLHQHKCLHNCSRHVKNTVINCYGIVYAIENLQSIGSRIRSAHRLPDQVCPCGLMFTCRPARPYYHKSLLYSAYDLDVIVVTHRRRRNNFLFRARCSENMDIRCIIGNLQQITVWTLFFSYLCLFYCFHTCAGSVILASCATIFKQQNQWRTS